MHHYSIANAKNSLSRIVHEAEEGETIHLSRRGKLVAVLLFLQKSIKKMNKKQSSPADALQQFLMDKNHKDVDIDPAVFEGLRVKSSGRELHLLVLCIYWIRIFCLNLLENHLILV